MCEFDSRLGHHFESQNAPVQGRFSCRNAIVAQAYDAACGSLKPQRTSALGRGRSAPPINGSVPSSPGGTFQAVAKIARDAVDFVVRWLKSRVMRSAMAGAFRVSVARESLTWGFAKRQVANGRDSAHRRPHICPSQPALARIAPRSHAAAGAAPAARERREGADEQHARPRWVRCTAGRRTAGRRTAGRRTAGRTRPTAAIPATGPAAAPTRAA
jgi:hypothetical protein